MFTKREMMLLMNGLAMTADVLNVSSKGVVPSCQEFDALLESRDFAHEQYNEQPALTFQELNDLFTKVWLIVNKQYNELAELPPTPLQ